MWLTGCRVSADESQFWKCLASTCGSNPRPSVLQAGDITTRPPSCHKPLTSTRGWDNVKLNAYSWLPCSLFELNPNKPVKKKQHATLAVFYLPSLNIVARGHKLNIPSKPDRPLQHFATHLHVLRQKNKKLFISLLLWRAIGNESSIVSELLHMKL